MTDKEQVQILRGLEKRSGKKRSLITEWKKGDDRRNGAGIKDKWQRLRYRDIDMEKVYR